MHYLQDMIGSESAEARAHPDKTRDVWELAVWDPYPATLQIFCFFSPGHVLVHYLFLPLPQMDPRPSVTVFKCLILQIILSAQLLLLQSRFSQQARDTAIIQKEVMNEYNTKFVHPRLHTVVRDAAVQVSIGDSGIEQESVEVGTPNTPLLRGFRTNPNPNYAKYYDPDNTGQPASRNIMSPSLFTPVSKPSRPSDAFTQMGRSSALRQSLPPSLAQSVASPPIHPRQSLPVSPPQQQPSSVSSSVGSPSVLSPSAAILGAGNLGVYQHMNSPLKKTTSLGDMKSPVKNSREMAALEQREMADRMIRQTSPLKENRRATTHGLGVASGTQASATYNAATARANRWNQERFPSRY